MRSFASLACSSLLLTSFVATQQVAPSNADAPAVLQKLGLSGGSIQDLVVPQQNVWRPFLVSVAFGGQVRTLRLRPHKLLSCDFQLLVDDGTAIRQVPNPVECAYRGEIVGVPGSAVAATLWDGRLRAYLDLAGETWAIEPVEGRSSARHIVYRDRDIAKRGRCGLSTVTRARGHTGTPAASALQSCEIAIDCDSRYYADNGRNVTKTRNAAIAVINGCDLIYRRDVTICYTITTILVRTSVVYRNGPNTGCVGSGLLQEFEARWNQYHKGVKRDLAHLFSGWSTNSSAGCATLGVVCSQTKGYGVSDINLSLASNIQLVAHELGHNWNARHCTGSTCKIMCGSGSIGCGSGASFGPTSKMSILAHKASRTCLGRCGGCSNEAAYGYHGSSCRGTGKGAGPGCVRLNWNSTLNGAAWTSAQNHAIPGNTGANAVAIQSVDLYCRSWSGTKTINVWIYDKASTGQPGKVLGASSMRVGTNAAAYRATFAAPITLAAKTDFYVVYANPASGFSAPMSKSGTKVAAYFGSGSNWFTFAAANDYWNFRLNCTTTGVSPVFAASAPPRLGSSYKLEIQGARPNAIAVLFHAVGTQSIALPGGCYLYVTLPAFDVAAAVTDGAGKASFNHGIPNNQQFCGIRFYQQVVIQDGPANALGWVLTRRGEPRIGN